MRLYSTEYSPLVTDFLDDVIQKVELAKKSVTSGEYPQLPTFINRSILSLAAYER